MKRLTDKKKAALKAELTRLLEKELLIKDITIGDFPKKDTFSICLLTPEGNLIRIRIQGSELKRKDFK